MAFLRKHLTLIVVAATCAAAGAAISAIATAGASTPRAARAWEFRHGRLGRHLRSLLRRGVHGTFVVHTASGYQTFTINRGFVQSVNGQQLTVRDGTRKASYHVVTLTIPASARVRDNRQRASLSALSAGQRVVVIQGPGRTWVRAHTARVG